MHPLVVCSLITGGASYGLGAARGLPLKASLEGGRGCCCGSPHCCVATGFSLSLNLKFLYTLHTLECARRILECFLCPYVCMYVRVARSTVVYLRVHLVAHGSQPDRVFVTPFFLSVVGHFAILLLLLLLLWALRCPPSLSLSIRVRTRLLPEGRHALGGRRGSLLRGAQRVLLRPWLPHVLQPGHPQQKPGEFFMYRYMCASDVAWGLPPCDSCHSRQTRRTKKKKDSRKMGVLFCTYIYFFPRVSQTSIRGNGCCCCIRGTKACK